MANNPMKLTKVQLENIREYNRQIGYTKSMLTRAKNRGWIFDDDLIPDLTTIDHIPRKKDIEKLKRARKHLYEQGLITDYSTGEIIEGTAGREYEKKLTSKQRAERLSIKSAIENVDVTPEPQSNITDYENGYEPQYEYDEYDPLDWEELEDIETPFDPIDYIDPNLPREAMEILDNIEHDIESLLRIYTGTHYKNMSRSGALTIVYNCQDILNTISRLKEDLTDAKYLEYLRDNADRINALVTQLEDCANQTSDGEGFTPASQELISMLLGRPLSLEENQSISDTEFELQDFEL